MKAALPVGLPDRWMVGLSDLEPQDVVREVREVVGVPDLEPEIENVARSITRSSSPSATASAARSWSATPRTASARAGRRG